jgi:hypothetical protein
MNLPDSNAASAATLCAPALRHFVFFIGAMNFGARDSAERLNCSLDSFLFCRVPIDIGFE